MTTLHLTAAEARALGLTAPRKRQRSAAKGPAYPTFEAQCAAHGLPSPLREFAFHLERRWMFDFAWLHPKRIALEVEGGIYGRGKPCPTCKRRRASGHSSIANIKRDIVKYNEAALLGWTVLRCLPEDVESGKAFELVKRALGERT